MDAGFAKDRVKNFRGAVGHLALLGKSSGRLHIDVDGKNLLDSIQRSKSSKQQRDSSHDADFCRQLSLRQRDIPADGALDDHGVADARNLTADKGEIVVHDQRRIISAYLDLAVEIVTEFKGNLPKARFPAHFESFHVNF